MKTKPQEAKKTAKTLKGQLFGALSMMLVASIALGTSTYAWFINNQTVEVENMQLEVSTSTSLLVKVEKQGTANTWTNAKSVVTNEDITTNGGALDGAGWTDFLTTPMVPASTTDASLKTAAGGATFFMTDNHVSGGKLDQFLAVPSARDKAGVGQGPVKHLGLTFVASSKTDVYFGAKELTDLANLITARTEGTAPVGSTWADQATAIKRALRVAVFPAGADKATVLQFDSGTVIPDNGNNTDYNSKASSLTHDETAGKYIGIASVGTTNVAPVGNKIETTGTLTAYLPTAATTKYLATVNKDTGVVTAPTDAGAAPLFTVPAGKDGLRVDVYIWLEGTDHDCLNELSGYSYNLRLPFAGVLNTEATPAP